MKRVSLVLVVLFSSVPVFATNFTFSELEKKVSATMGEEPARFFHINTRGDKNPLAESVEGFYEVSDDLVNDFAVKVNEGAMTQLWNANSDDYWDNFTKCSSEATEMLTKKDRIDELNNAHINKVANGILNFLDLYYRYRDPKFDKSDGSKFMVMMRRNLRINAFDPKEWAAVILQNADSVASQK